MPAPDETPPSPSERQRSLNISEHLANERTHLAYLRTSVSVISLGIAVNRFSLYLAESKALPPVPQGTWLDARNLGAGMAGFGTLLMGWAFVRYRQVRRQIDRQDYRPNQLMIALITSLVLLLGSFSILWLFLTHP